MTLNLGGRRSRSAALYHYMHDNRGEEESGDLPQRKERGGDADGGKWRREADIGEILERGGETEAAALLKVDKEAVQKAAALLVNISSLFQGFCDPCVKLLRSRLEELASGQLFISNGDTKPGLEEIEQGKGRFVVSNRDANYGTEEDEPEKGIHELEPADDGAIQHNGLVSTDDPEVTENHAAVDKAAPAPVIKQLTTADRERLRLLGLKRKKDFVCLERINGRPVNITAGLELHTGVFSKVEQQKLVSLVRELQAKGRRQELKERTYSEPRKWMRGKGRVTIQFGCCYNYAEDKYGNPPGILREDVVDPLPPLLRTTIKRLIRWHVLPPTCVPDSCIVNIYDEGDCIPPHIDHHDFLRPFCTLSLLSECSIVFGANLKIVGPGEFDGKLAVSLPVGSVLVLNGNGADVAKHAVPAVPTERISITFRKMDLSKVPYNFTIDDEMQNLRPVILPSPESPEMVADDRRSFSSF